MSARIIDGIAIGREIRAGEHGDDAGRGQGGRRIDRTDSGMRMRRTQNGRVSLAGQVDIIEVAAAAGEQPQIFLADNRLTHPELHGTLSVLRESPPYCGWRGVAQGWSGAWSSGGRAKRPHVAGMSPTAPT